MTKAPSTISAESDLEALVRAQIASRVTAQRENIYALRNKKAVDILICKDGDLPELFFIEVKFHRLGHGRLGFGGGRGVGFQPEILQQRPTYFDRNLRWVLGAESRPGKVLFLTCEEIAGYVCGGEIGEKYNNIQQRVFREGKWMTFSELGDELGRWLV